MMFFTLYQQVIMARPQRPTTTDYISFLTEIAIQSIFDDLLEILKETPFYDIDELNATHVPVYNVF